MEIEYKTSENKPWICECGQMLVWEAGSLSAHFESINKQRIHADYHKLSVLCRKCGKNQERQSAFPQLLGYAGVQTGSFNMEELKISVPWVLCWKA